jgi:hypothetical protein
MRFLTRCCVIAAIVSTIATANDFPLRVGNWWLFSYRTVRGGLGVSMVDSGTVRWTINAIYPGNTVQWITIEQTRSLMRSTYRSPIGGGASDYDSIFIPPRVTMTAETLMNTYGKNAITRSAFVRDTCPILAFEPSALSSTQALVTVGKMWYHGDSVITSRIDPSPCRNGGACAAPQYFTTGLSIGPVGYFNANSPCMLDAINSETWTLIDHYAPIVWMEPDTLRVGVPAFIDLHSYETTCAPDSIAKTLSLDADDLFLTYQAYYSPLKDCYPVPGYRMTAQYSVTPQASGKFPVYVENLPFCYPKCLDPTIVIRARLIDTLVILPAAGAMPTKNHETKTVPESVSYQASTLRVSGMTGSGAIVRVFRINGTLVLSQKVTNASAVAIPIRLVSGFYFVEIESGTQGLPRRQVGLPVLGER